MVYRKKQMRKKRYVKRKTVKAMVNRAVNSRIELKEKVWPYDAVGISPVSGVTQGFNSIGYGTLGIVTQLARSIANGTNDGERIGHRITIKGVQLKLVLQAAGTTEPNNFRIVVYRPKGTYSTSTTAAMLQQLLSNNGGTSTQYAQTVDTDFALVYMDKLMYLPLYDAGGVAFVKSVKLNRFIKFPRGLKIEWSEANGNPNRDIFIALLSDSGASANPGAIAGFVKVWYTDA